MEYPQIDIRELCLALGIEYDVTKSTSFYLMLVKDYRFRYKAAQQRAHLTCATCGAINAFEYDKDRRGEVCVRCGTRR